MILCWVREWIVLFLLTDRQRTLLRLVSIEDAFPLGIAWWTSETIPWDLGNRGYLDQ